MLSCEPNYHTTKYLRKTTSKWNTQNKCNNDQARVPGSVDSSRKQNSHVCMIVFMTIRNENTERKWQQRDWNPQPLSS